MTWSPLLLFVAFISIFMKAKLKLANVSLSNRRRQDGNFPSQKDQQEFRGFPGLIMNNNNNDINKLAVISSSTGTQT